MKNDLSHYGIKGMRWGVIRSGPSTTQLQIGKSSMESATNIISKTKEIDKSARNIHRVKDITDMSDDDLKKEIERMNLERSYKDAVSRSTTSGQEYVKETLDIAGNVLAVGATAVGLALTIKQLRGA